MVQEININKKNKTKLKKLIFVGLVPFSSYSVLIGQLLIPVSFIE